jgi:RNA ligase (TIGR02306 family)
MKLASIERITALTPIKGADRIELARVLGFNTVVKKNEFKVGDLCVFHIPDTIVDSNNPVYDFLAAQGHRLKISKFKGVYSQGLALPVRDFEKRMLYPLQWGEGMDATELTGIRKYEKPLPEGSEAIGGLPSFLRKTDEPNILTKPDLLAQFNGLFVYFSKKMDGQSATFYLNNGAFGVCSRNQELRDTPNSPFWNIAREYHIEQIMREYGGDFVLQGELYGPGIQGNRMGAQIKQLALFNYFDSGEHSYKDAGRLLDLCQRFNLPMVETVWSGQFNHSLEELQSIADNLKYDNGAPAEGIVIRPVREVICPDGERLSAKIISQKFLAKHDE